MSSDVEISTRHLLITQRLRQRRDDLGLTQKQVVTRLGRCGLRTTNRALSSLEHGTGLDVAKLPGLAAALECTVTYLLGLTDDPHRWSPDEDLSLPVRPKPVAAVVPVRPSAVAAIPAAATPVGTTPVGTTPVGTTPLSAAAATAPNGSLILGANVPEGRLRLR